MNSYENQNKWLAGLFSVLPQIALAVIGLLRFIVAVPLFIGGMEMFDFFGSQVLAITTSIIVVIALEIIGLLASLLTAFFRSQGLKKAFFISLVIGLFSMLFNAFLLKSIENLEIGIVAQTVFQCFNTLSFGLGEAIGFLVVSVNENETFIQEETKKTDNNIFTETEMKKDENTTIQEIEKLTPALVSQLKLEGKTHQEIAERYGTNISKVSRLKKEAEGVLEPDSNP